MPYRGAPLPRGTSSREKRGEAIRLNYFIPSAPSFFRAAAAAAGISEAARERRIKSGGEWRGEGEEEKRGEDDADKDEGKDKEEQEETTRRSIPPPGYCIRIYYNLRIPEEEKDCGGAGEEGHTVSTEERWTRKER